VNQVFAEIAGYADELTRWRHHLHQHPELDLACHATAEFVVARLQEFGVTDIQMGFAESGVVAVIEGTGHGPVTALRADMDALPIDEQTGLAWRSKTAGVMHACGHDGHTTMLLGAAKYLSRHKHFRGKGVLIFQPAEELSGGGRIMVEEGVMERFGVEEVYALHTLPGKQAGTFHTKSGAFLASVDDFQMRVVGQGGHAGSPTLCKNPIDRLASLLTEINEIERDLNTATEQGVIAVTVVAAGHATNVVPESATLNGTVRTLSEAFRDAAEQRLRVLSLHQVNGVGTEFTYWRYYPTLINHENTTRVAGRAAMAVSGKSNVDLQCAPQFVSEDFSYMLQARPGCFLFLGQGAGPGLHHPKFDFNDAVAPVGASYFVRLVEERGGM